MSTYYRKSYEIVAYTFDGDIYCLECAEDLRPTDYVELNPVFLDMIESPETCGTCGETIE